MALQIGIVGLPNVGKSTLFNALTRSKGAQAANYPFCTIEPNVGIVEVPDERLEKISAMVKPEKTVPTTVRFVDIAGLVKGASVGEGLGNQFLSHIREVDAICEVVRLFADPDVIHVEGSVDGKRDIETISTELILADLQTITKRLDRVRNASRTGNKEALVEFSVLERVHKALHEGALASTVELHTDEERLIIQAFQLLTMKPFLYAVNVGEQDLGSLTVEDVQARLGVRSQPVLISAKIEEELGSLPVAEAKEYLQSLGVQSSGLEKLIRAAYDNLGLITFLTAGPKECRAWTVHKGAFAPQAAGVIHSDFERGFICAETIDYGDFISHNGEHGAKEAGKLRKEGKEYIVKDGDIFHFRFNV